MFTIIGGLLGGWILGLFGFKAVVIAGMAQVFGVTINVLGYYFLFAMMGALKSVATFFNPSRHQIKDSNTEKLGKSWADLTKNKK